MEQRSVFDVIAAGIVRAWFCPHVHRYHPTWEDGITEPAGPEFGDTNDPVACLRAFMAYCNIVDLPAVAARPEMFP